jgi:hypothetical protein
VRGNNAIGSSGWSNVQCVQVTQPSGPNPGYWSGQGVEFYVTSDRQHVDDFAVSIYIQACSMSVKVTHNTQEAIANNSFSFSGSYYASGTFSSNTAASGNGGFDHFYIYGCGYLTGTFTWSATWQHSAQATFDQPEILWLEGEPQVLQTFKVIPEVKPK